MSYVVADLMTAKSYDHYRLVISVSVSLFLSLSLSLSIYIYPFFECLPQRRGRGRTGKQLTSEMAASVACQIRGPCETAPAGPRRRCCGAATVTVTVAAAALPRRAPNNCLAVVLVRQWAEAAPRPREGNETETRERTEEREREKVACMRVMTRRSSRRGVGVAFGSIAVAVTRRV